MYVIILYVYNSNNNYYYKSFIFFFVCITVKFISLRDAKDVFYLFKI